MSSHSTCNVCSHCPFFGTCTAVLGQQISCLVQNGAARACHCTAWMTQQCLLVVTLAGHCSPLKHTVAQRTLYQTDAETTERPDEVTQHPRSFEQYTRRPSIPVHHALQQTEHNTCAICPLQGIAAIAGGKTTQSDPTQSTACCSLLIIMNMQRAAR